MQQCTLPVERRQSRRAAEMRAEPQPSLKAKVVPNSQSPGLFRGFPRYMVAQAPPYSV